MSTPEMPSAPAPAKKSNTLIIVLCVVFGVLLLILASCVGTCIYVGKKAKAYARESEKNPQISALALAATIAPGIEVVSKDLDAGTIVLKNTKTGEIVKLDARNFSQDRIASVIERISQGKSVNGAVRSDSTASAEESKAAPSDTGSTESSSPAIVSVAQSTAQESTLKTFRSDFPIYTGGGVITLEASQNGLGGMSTSQHVFETNDSPEKVADFFVKKLTSDGYTVLASENSSNSNGPKLSRVLQKGGMGATVILEVRAENGKTHTEVNQVVLKQ